MGGPHPACQVVGYARIKNSIVRVGHYINTVIFANCHAENSISCRFHVVARRALSPTKQSPTARRLLRRGEPLLATTWKRHGSWQRILCLYDDQLSQYCSLDGRNQQPGTPGAGPHIAILVVIIGPVQVILTGFTVLLTERMRSAC